MVAWVDRRGTFFHTNGPAVSGFQLHVRCWTGMEWLEVTSFEVHTNNVGITPAPCLVVDQNRRDTITLVWAQWPSTSSSGFQTGPKTEISLRQFSSGVPITDFPGAMPGDNAHVGTGVSGTLGNSMVPGLALDGDSMPHVVWEEFQDINNRVEIYYKYFDAGTLSWRERDLSAHTGGISNSFRTSQQPTLVLRPDGNPIVSWSEHQQAKVVDWDGNAWSSAIPFSTPNGSFRPSLAADEAGLPMLAWQEETNGEKSQIHFSRFTNGGWAGGGRVAHTPGFSIEPVVRHLVNDNTSVVAWADDSSGNFEIYVRGWSPFKKIIDRTICCWQPPFQMIQISAIGAKIEEGQSVAGCDVVLGARVTDDQMDRRLNLALEVEVANLDTGFKGIPTARSEFVPAGSQAIVRLGGLSTGPKRWQARTVGPDGISTDWVPFEVVGKEGIAFVVES